MRLTRDDLKAHARRAEKKTNWQFTITATKKDNRGVNFVTLELIDNRTQTLYPLGSFDGIRGAYEYLRAFYKGLEYSRLLTE